jgi:protease IV
MAINADTLLDRLYLKSQITKWRILAVVFAVAALIISAERFNKHSPIEKEFVARLTLDGIITDNQKIYTLIDDLADNPKAKAVIIWLDTPGGSAVAGEETFRHLRTLSQKKPVVAVMRSLSASAGYMIALGADHIFAREGTITGSIGVMVESAEVTDLAEKLGIKPIIIKSSPLKGVPSPLEKVSPESERVIRELITDFYNHFVDMVAERRNLPRDKVVTLADGRVYSGKSAFQNKLIDAIGGEEDAMNWLVKEKNIKQGLDIKDIKIDEEISLFGGLAESIAGKIFQKSSVMLDGMVAIWHPHLH